MLDKENKQETGNVENSTVNQAGRDIIYQNGLEIKDIIPIVNTLVESKIAAYAAQAKVTAQQRVLDFSKRLEEVVEEKVNAKINRFNEPSIQFATRKAALGYAKSGDEEQREDLIDLLIERIKVEEHTTEQNLIDEAIEVLPKLSKEALAFLVLISYRNLAYNGANNLLKKWFTCISPYLKYSNRISALDISFLQQSNCAFGISGINSHDLFEKECLENHELFFTHPINDVDSFKKFLNVFGLEKYGNDGIKGINNVNNFMKLMNVFQVLTPHNNVTIAISNKTVLNQIFQDPFLNEHKEQILEALNLFSPFTEEEVKQYFIRLDPNWEATINLYNKTNVRSFKPTPVGNYIASRLISKQWGESISLNVFYPN